MMKIKVIAITLCLLSVLIFSGCTTKYIVKPCEIEIVEIHDNGICNQELDDFEFAKCASKYYKAALTDRQQYKNAYEGCK